MKIDIIIASYNRIKKAQQLAYSLLELLEFEVKVLIVDSTKNQTKVSFSNSKITHVLSSYANQPYQRYLGYLNTTADYILFLDDDMKIKNQSDFNIIFKLFKEKNIVGINLPFSNENAFLSKRPKSVFRSFSASISNIIGLISGYPNVPDNSYYFCGLKGKRINDKPIEYVSGGSFIVKREHLYKNFNMQLFDLYANNLGKGEDGILGYSLSKYGEIHSASNEVFTHIDLNDSTYSQSSRSFSKRLLFSRLYLSLEYARLSKKSFLMARVKFHHFSLGRILSLTLNYLLKHDEKIKSELLGYIDAWILSFSFKYNPTLEINDLWKSRALKDTSNK
jgi:glycosyltransferase involved in cell wall biosynthesis